MRMLVGGLLLVGAVAAAQESSEKLPRIFTFSELDVAVAFIDDVVLIRAQVTRPAARKAAGAWTVDVGPCAKDKAVKGWDVDLQGLTDDGAALLGLGYKAKACMAITCKLTEQLKHRPNPGATLVCEFVGAKPVIDPTVAAVKTCDEDGAVRTKDGHCCFPGQRWSKEKSACVGLPTKCPPDYVPYNMGKCVPNTDAPCGESCHFWKLLRAPK